MTDDDDRLMNWLLGQRFDDVRCLPSAICRERTRAQGGRGGWGIIDGWLCWTPIELLCPACCAFRSPLSAHEQETEALGGGVCCCFRYYVFLIVEIERPLGRKPTTATIALKRRDRGAFEAFFFIVLGGFEENVCLPCGVLPALGTITVSLAARLL